MAASSVSASTILGETALWLGYAEAVIEHHMSLT